MNVLSLFDGISGGYEALRCLGIKPDKYYASEIDKYALQVSRQNHPDIIYRGDIRNITKFDIADKIDLLIAGFPCQDLSIAKKDRKGLDGDRSSLFWELVRLINEINPTYFLVENVNSMSRDNKQVITDALGVEPILINSALVTAQSRKRLYWTNIEGVAQPEDKKIYLQDIIESGVVDREKSYCIDASYYKGTNLESYFKKRRRQIVFNKPFRLGSIGKDAQGNRVYGIEGKSVTLSANGGGRGAKTGLYAVNNLEIRKLTPTECEILQGFPRDYTKGISNTQRYRCLGNSFTVPVITSILKNIKQFYI